MAVRPERRANGCDAARHKSTNFQKADYWRLHGGLDVPKERFVSFPHCSRDADGSLVIAWAGLNPLQLGTAIATWYLDNFSNKLLEKRSGTKTLYAAFAKPRLSE